MTAISKASPNFFQRDTSLAFGIYNETRLIATVALNAFQIAREVAPHAKELSKGSQVPVGTEKITFKITNEFLIYLVKPSAKTSPTLEKVVTSQSLARVAAFFSHVDLSSFCFFNPHRIKESEIQTTVRINVSLPLEIAYRQHKDWFKKIDIHPSHHKFSCFEYVIVESGFNFEEFLKFLHHVTKDQRAVSFFDYIAFLKSKGMQEASLPMQSGDILVYYNDNKEIIHAALVAKDPKQVYTKFGDINPYAYLHHVDETPIEYGKLFQIFRKKAGTK